jgi:hypothetical protein
MPVEIVVALISALLSALAIFWTVRNARRQRDHETLLRKKQEDFESATFQAQRDHETQLRKKQEEFEQDLELLRGRLREVEAERDARRDYEYEARKRLYSEIQPLLFQLKELSESAYRWVMSLARTAQQDQLSWLSKGYFLSMTLYRFTAPLAVFRLIHRLRVQYNIAKQMYLSISDGFSIAKAGGEHRIVYDPHEVRRLRRRRRRITSIHTQQHLFRGHLDMIADALVVREPEGSRCMTYGEFETQFKNPESDVYHAIGALAAGFSGFRPRSRPVVWRMLIIQMYFHKALLHTFEPETPVLRSPADLLSKEEREKLDWRREDGSESHIPDEEVLVWPFKAAEEYVGERLRGFFKD